MPTARSEMPRCRDGSFMSLAVSAARMFSKCMTHLRIDGCPWRRCRKAAIISCRPCRPGICLRRRLLRLPIDACSVCLGLDPASDRWSELSPMPEPRLAGAAVSLGNYLYVVGGVGGTAALLRYDPADSWVSLALFLSSLASTPLPLP